MLTSTDLQKSLNQPSTKFAILTILISCRGSTITNSLLLSKCWTSIVRPSKTTRYSQITLDNELKTFKEDSSRNTGAFFFPASGSATLGSKDERYKTTKQPWKHPSKSVRGNYKENLMGAKKQFNSIALASAPTTESENIQLFLPIANFLIPRSVNPLSG